MIKVVCNYITFVLFMYFVHISLKITFQVEFEYIIDLKFNKIFFETFFSLQIQDAEYNRSM